VEWGKRWAVDEIETLSWHANGREKSMSFGSSDGSFSDKSRPEDAARATRAGGCTGTLEPQAKCSNEGKRCILWDIETLHGTTSRSEKELRSTSKLTECSSSGAT
jgi:hypothetical protein